MNWHVLLSVLAVWETTKEASQCSTFSRCLSHHTPTNAFLHFLIFPLMVYIAKVFPMGTSKNFNLKGGKKYVFFANYCICEDHPYPSS